MSRTGKIFTSQGTEGDHPRWQAHQVSFQSKYSFLAIGTARLSRIGPGAIMCDVFSATYMRKIVSRRFDCPGKTLAVMLCASLLYLSFGAAPVHALDPKKRVTQYIHTAWRTQDGSLPAGMYHIVQTSDGFLWFLSLPADIYRFDGIRFLPWSLPAGAPIDRSLNIFADHAGGLWVLGPADIVRLKGAAVSSHFKLEGGMFQSVSEASDGSLWVLGGNSDAPLCRVTDSLKCFGKADGIPISEIQSLLGDGDGGFWLGGRTGGLVHWHAGTSEKYNVENEVFSLARGPDGSLWVGTSGEGPGKGLQQLKDGDLKSVVVPPFNGSGFDIGTLMFDHDGNLWVGTKAKGLFRIHGDAVEHYDHTNGLSGDSVYALFEDREGIVWAGTTSGIDSFRDPPVVTFSQAEGLGKDLPAGILASRDGTIWVANAGSLDHIVNGNVSSIRTGKGLPGEQVTRLLEDRAGNLWVGVDDGLYLFKNGQFERLPEPNHQPLGMVIGLIEDIDGNIWAECRGKPQKLVRIRDFQVREVFPAPQVPPAWMLAADPNGGIWIATRKGDLVQFRQGVQRKFPLNPNAKNPAPHAIRAQPDSSVLAAFDDGLVGFREGKVQRMTTKNGLPCDFVISFIQDREKRWWLYTRCGIVEFSDSELQRWWTNPDAIVRNHVYDTFDGAQPNIPAFNSAACSADGRVWFTSGVVVQMVDPVRLSQEAIPAQAYIEGLVADRKKFEATPNLNVPPNPRDLQIDYTSPTFSIPQKVNFRYRLDHYDRDWHEAGTRRQAFYTDLPPGKYSFRVIVSNGDGVWNDNAATLDFSVAPAYYQTNYFRALCALLLLALLWTAYQWRVRRLHHEFEMTLEARVSERTRIARELHDSLLQSFHGLLLRFQTVFQLLPERPMEAKEKLGSAIEQTADAITEGRDAVQGLRDSTVQGNDLALAISTLGEELTTDSTNRPAFHVAVEGEARNLHPILRDEVYKIAAEALRNAFRHSRARQIEAEIRYDTEQFRLRVRDNGKGVDPAILSSQGSEGHYGLPGMRERATLIGGKLAVWSEVDEGTEVELRVPASTAYARAQRSSWFSRKAKA
jgi:signal transduction histidine kinase/ligand-binding sensor domain-containing protein